MSASMPTLDIHGVSKKSGESYQKNQITQYKHIFFISLQNGRHPLQHTFDNVIQLPEIISKGLL